MDEYQLAEVLRAMVDRGEATREKTVMIHLFGVKYARELREVDIGAVLVLADVESSWKIEVAKMMNLSKYVAAK